MTAIIALLLNEPLFGVIPTARIGTIALWVAAVLTLWSMLHYLRLAAPHLRGEAVTEARTTITRVGEAPPPGVGK
jgi:phosphatidylglycerophosphate synthase